MLACGDGYNSTGLSGAPGRTIYAVDAQNGLLNFGENRPDQVTRRGITGLPAGESIVGIDFQPSTGQLPALGMTSRIYTIDITTAAATAIGTAPFTPTLTGTAFGFDFNPVPNRIRVHTDADQDLRIVPANPGATGTPGAVAFVDGTRAYAAGDAGAGTNPSIAGTAYTNSIAPAATSPAPTATVLFAIDAARDVLVRLANPNDGLLTTVGPLGVATTTDVGFDIAGTTEAPIAYATLTPSATSRSRLYTISTATGAATLVGEVRNTAAIRGIAISPTL